MKDLATRITSIIGIGFVLTVLLLLGATLYQVADLLWYFGIFLLSVASLSIIFWLVLSGFAATDSIRTKKKLNSYECRLREAEAEASELKANLIQSGGEAWVRERIPYLLPDGNQGIRIEFARLGGILQRINSHSHIPTEADRLLAMTQVTTGQTKMLGSGQIIPQLLPPTELLSLLDKADRVLVKGASDAGKTTILQHIAQRSNGVFIIDPHFAPGIWPVARSRIVGAGRDYPAIDKFLAQLMAEVNGRYLRRAKGELNFEPITLIIDEFNSIRAECDQAGRIISTLIRESRKVHLRLFIGSHSELVKPLGLEGQGDVREGLLIVRLSVDQITKQRVCKVDDGNRELDCWFPPFGSVAQPVSLPAEPVILRPTNQEQQIISLHEAGASMNEIARQVFGHIGGNQNKAIKEILVKFGYVSA